MLSAQHLHVSGRRDELLPPISLQTGRGRLLLAAGAGQDQRTALSLSGRMKSSSGTVTWDGSPRIRNLRRASAVVDSPGVNDPEQHLSVRDLVSEDLGLVPGRSRGALSGTSWLKVHGFEDIAGLWTEQLPADRRIELLAALALADPRVNLLVVDSPDRHSGYPADWLPRLEELAYDAGRPLAVVATVARIPQTWTGPAAVIGNAAAQAGDDLPQPERLETFETEDEK